MMNQLIELSSLQVRSIKNLAEKVRQDSGFSLNTPIGNDIFNILDNLGIYLLEYPIETEGNRKAFSAALIYTVEDERELAFLGLNTADYFDKQVFAIAHELYHYHTKTGSHLSRLYEDETTIIEAEANRFAAEYLLPQKALEDIVFNDFKSESLKTVEHRILIRFIARVHCTWWLPYRSIVKRLKEIDLITEEQYTSLYELDERDPNGEFSKICTALNKDAFMRLNNPTHNIGTSAKDLEVIIRNFEDGLIDEGKFDSILTLFGRKPSDFGYEIFVSDDDLDELEAFFNLGDEDEN